MSRGGARRGAGRPLGSITKKPRLLDENIVVDSDPVVASDTTIDRLLKVAHDPNASVAELLEASKIVLPYLRARIGVRTAPTESDYGKVVLLQPVAIPSNCFLTDEQIENPALLMENAVPMTDVVLEKPEVLRPKRAKVHSPPAASGTIIGAAIQAKPKEIDDETPDDIVA